MDCGTKQQRLKFSDLTNLSLSNHVTSQVLTRKLVRKSPPPSYPPMSFWLRDALPYGLLLKFHFRQFGLLRVSAVRVSAIRVTPPHQPARIREETLVPGNLFSGI